MDRSATCTHCGTPNPATFNFCGACGRPLRDSPPPVLPSTPDAGRNPPTGATRAERRQLTVMFCDLVGSTSLSLNLDPEDLRDVVRAYQRACVKVIDGYEGYIAQYLGDGVLVYFGYPAAHEDAAERAVLAGLGILQEMEVLNDTLRYGDFVDLAVRIGIHTGLVVIGEMGSGARRENLAMGNTPNLAARLQNLAEPNTVVISDSTHRLVGAAFDCEDLGHQVMKGLSQSMAAYRVRGKRDSGEVADYTRSLLVGRDVELARLMAAWQSTLDGHGRVALIRGEAGIGKSHLAQAFKQSADIGTHSILEVRCSPYHQNSAFYPFVDLLQRTLNFYPQQPPEERLDTIEFVLDLNGFNPHDTVPLLASLLSVPLLDRYAPPGFSPQAQRQHIERTLLELILKMSEEQPLLLLVEDLHWVDPSTLGLMTRLLDLVSTDRVFVLCTARPTYEAGWLTDDHLLIVDLERLDLSQVTQLIEETTAGKTLPAPIIDQIVKKTDGIPLFVYELTRMVVESNLVVERGNHYDLTLSAPNLSIPATLQDSLMARLDRLSPIKEVAQLCATIGREFSFALLASVSDLSEDALRAALDRLIAAGLLSEQGVHPRIQYVFRHALIQDAAYQSLLKRQRQQFHARIATRLEMEFEEVRLTQPELLAYHFARAGRSAKASRYWLAAGNRALHQSADQEAVSYFREGLHLIESREEHPEHAQTALMLYAGLGMANMQLSGFMHPDVREAFERAYALGESTEDAPDLIPVLAGLWANSGSVGENKRALAIAERLIRLAEQSGDAWHMLGAKTIHAASYFNLGNVRKAHALIAGLPDTHPTLFDGSTSALSISHPGVDCLTYLSLSAWFRGYAGQAFVYGDQALDLARRTGHAFCRVVALGTNLVLCACAADAERAREQTDRLIELARAGGFSFWVGVGEMLKAWCDAEEDLEAGYAALLGIFEHFRDSGLCLWMGLPTAMLCDLHLRRRTEHQGLCLVDTSIQIMEGNHEGILRPELLRLRGELLLRLHRPAEALEAFESALTLARQQGARMLELRTLVSLTRQAALLPDARAYPSQLADFYQGFTEGFNSPDLEHARLALGLPEKVSLREA